MNKIPSDIDKICPLCNSVAALVYKDMNGYVLDTKYNVFECCECLTQFVDPMSNLKEEYEIIYGGTTKKGSYDYYYYLAHGTKKLRNPLFYLKNYSAVFWGVIQALEDLKIKPGSKILEVGSGLGYLTYALNKSGYRCEGLDYSDTAVSSARELFGNKHSQGDIETFSKKNKNFYDVIIATEVIEHVVDPVLFVKYSLDALKVGGRLILTTPIKDIHPKGTIWETEPAPIHLWWFTEKGISAIADQFKSKASFVDFTQYTKNKIWSVHVAKENKAPIFNSVVTKDRVLIHSKKFSYKTLLMKILPPWLYIYLVCFYHDLKFLQRNKPDSKYMYGMCAIITKEK
jgi:SAM-dependent methyltransferase